MTRVRHDPSGGDSGSGGPETGGPSRGAGEAVSFPLRRTDPSSFTGEAYSSLLADSAPERPTRVYYVRFAARARTYWHAHAGTQILLVQEGTCLLQREGGPIERHPQGSVVRIPPGKRHWHGADPDHAMVHVALNLESPHTDWLGAVSDTEYGGAETSA